MANAPGFHGKVPALGDFVSRHLPAPFLASWDRWLAEMVSASRAALGADWLAAWNKAPVWHFGLGIGVIGPQRWFGVLIPSVDRIGRQYPFTILGPSDESGAAFAEWSRRIEALALGALEDGFDPSLLGAALDALGGPTRATEGAFADLPPGTTLWSCLDAALVPATVLRCAGLPSAAQSASLIAAAAASPQPAP